MDLRSTECVSATDATEEFRQYVNTTFSKKPETYGELVSNLETAKEHLICALRAARVECARKSTKLHKG